MPERRRTALETAVRGQKDIANLAKAAGDDMLRREAQAKINELEKRYTKVSKAAELAEQKSRMTVAGFRRVKTAEELKTPVKDGIIKTSTKAGGEGVQYIGRIEKAEIVSHWGNIRRDVVLTDERIAHIREGHAADYDSYGKYISGVLALPDYILEDGKNANTAMFIAHVEETNINVIVKLAFEHENSDLKSSVITMYRLGDKTIKRLIKKNLVVYKRENL